MPRSLASSEATVGPAPPNATSAKSRGVWPRYTDTSRMALAILSTASRTMPSAIARRSMPPSRSASGATAARDSSAWSGISPDSGSEASSRLSRRLASVTVAAWPPRP